MTATFHSSYKKFCICCKVRFFVCISLPFWHSLLEILPLALWEWLYGYTLMDSFSCLFHSILSNNRRNPPPDMFLTTVRTNLDGSIFPGSSPLLFFFAFCGTIPFGRMYTPIICIRHFLSAYAAVRWFN